jgi:outer membrane usher protein
MMTLRLIITLALAMGTIATRSAATELRTAVPTPQPAQTLFVELIVNGVSSETIVPLQIADDRMLIEGHLLRRAGLTFASERLVDLANLQGVRSSYDVATQTLNLDVEPELLPTRRIVSARNTRLPTVADYGAMLNYDAYAQRSGGTTTASLWSEQRLFGPVGTLSNSGMIRFKSGGGAKAKTYLRFDTSFRHADENRAIVITAGDLITRSLPWNRSFRLGGVLIW